MTGTVPVTGGQSLLNGERAMPILPRVVSFCRSIFRSAELDRDLDDELRSFADERTAHHLARGLTRDAARRAALLEIGGVEQVKERVRDQRIGWSFETLIRDVRYGARMLARAPGFSAVVIATLARQRTASGHHR